MNIQSNSISRVGTTNDLLEDNISSDVNSFNFKRPKSMRKTFMYVFLFYTLFLFYVINAIVRNAYMDEIFHYPQALRFYNGVFFQWDPKITTPPGLYFSSIVALVPLSKLTGLDFNKLECFRLTNVIFSIGNFYLAYKILRRLHGETEKRIHVLCALNVAMFPVLYFFSFLYYTDCGSTFFVLLMYYYHLKHLYAYAATAGGISLLFRQTNIVWLFYFSAEETLHTMFLICKEALQEKDKEISGMTFTQLKKLQPVWINNWKELMIRLCDINRGYIPVAGTFVVLIILNGSIALGDKAAHQACLNIPQIFHFLLFFLFFASPYLITWHKTKHFMFFVFSHKLYAFIAFLICIFCIVNFTHVHPYLLADNRHLTFYMWRRILGRNIYLSIALIPLYMYSAWAVMSSLKHKDIVFKIVLSFCIFISVVPQKLLEFRYFIIPYIMIRLNFRSKSKWKPYFEFLLHTVINYAVLYLFLFNTFSWPNSNETQRFMW